MDPADVVDWLIALTQLLEDEESVETYSLILSAEAVAMGLEICAGSGRDAEIVDASTGQPGAAADAIRIWLQVDEDMQDDAAFDGAGVMLPMELTIHTNSIPARTRQRTLVIRIGQL